MLVLRLLLALLAVFYLAALRWFLRYGTVAFLTVLLLVGKLGLRLRAKHKRIWRRLLQ